MLRLSTTDPDFERKFKRLVDNRRESEEDVSSTVAHILGEVRARGDKALAEYTERFDKHVLAADDDWRISPDACRHAYAALDPTLRDALELAAARIRAYHREQRPADRDFTDEAGVRLGAKWHPVDAAGLYVPGGRAAYPSSLLMNAIPARVAGVERLVVVTPTPKGEVNPLVLAAAHIAEVDEIWRVGGAQAIALVAGLSGSGWVDEPDFSLYRRHLPRLERAAPRWRSDPHSPTGLLAEPEDRAGVWDEAFLPLAAGVWTRGRPGWTVGSLTKAYACPGLRLGYAVAPDDGAAADLRRARPGWAVDSVACAVLPELLALADPAGWTAAIGRARAELRGVLGRHGHETLPSDSPWVLVPAAAGLRDALARRAVVVRDCSSFGLPDHVRIAVPDADGLGRLDRALRDVTASRGDAS